MVYQIIAVVICIVALIAFWGALKLLVSNKWMMGFLRGISGILLLAFTALLGFSAKDVSSYNTVKNNDTIATLSFIKKEGNSYKVELQEASGEVYSIGIEGQQWQLNTRMFRWTPLVSAMGFKQGYRLESISGRFIELQFDQMVGKREPEKLVSSKEIDIWKILHEYPSIFSLVDAYASTPGFIPVADGAIYGVVLSSQNLTITPLNDAAKVALKSW